MGDVFGIANGISIDFRAPPFAPFGASKIDCIAHRPLVDVNTITDYHGVVLKSVRCEGGVLAVGGDYLRSLARTQDDDGEDEERFFHK